MADNIKCDVLVVGAGPGGYVAAIRAGQLGLNTVIVEADRCGGTCLIRGCIPSKALIHAASRFDDIKSHLKTANMGISVNGKVELNFKETIAWKNSVVDKLNTGVEALLKKAGIRIIKGWAVFENGKTCTVEDDKDKVKIIAEHVIIATGSKVVELPFMPFGGHVISSTEALDLEEVPENLAVIGAGYIGVEIGSAYAKLGSKVTFVEAEDRILAGFDKEITAPVLKWLRENNVEILTNSKAKEASKDTLIYEDSNGKIQKIKADKILVAVGRKPNLDGWGLENIPVEMEGGFIKIDEQCRTSVRNVWAIGDVTGEPMLAHRASAQGEMVAEIIAGKKRHFAPRAIAAVCFTEPEIVAVGISAEKAKAKGIDTIVGKFPLAANGKALASGADKYGSFVRVTARKDNHKIIGIHAVGSHMAEMSGEFALAIEMDTRLEDIADTIHVHPTMSEALHEAALKALGHAIHI